MTFESVLPLIEDALLTSKEQARVLYAFVQEQQPQEILELGTASGATAVLMADAQGNGCNRRVTTLDRKHCLARKPNVHEVIARTPFGEQIDVRLAHRSYLWELGQLLKEHGSSGSPNPPYDFVFMDGAHTWDIDGFAFYLVDQLLRPGGWILFDDVHWTLAGSSSTPPGLLTEVGPEEASTAHVKQVLQLLVKPHPSYGPVEERGNWAWVQKLDGKGTSSAPIETAYKQRGVKDDLVALLKKLIGR
jgi:predicted O-methyltransferase YrrM